ncbi:MAG: 2-(1,2-epoxy-1,2-dihydrophenyl)acetyl-CoA isomerase [Candidatus Poseidoniales archaeon]|nr:MAG: 2-(1,2-epoxy-1,2-dihydrophenyl)acetyl-CoA isomerase [Candidatus Poseidoniales archaeon]
MAIEVEQHGHLRMIKMAGQASTQSFSMAFLPTIADAIDAGLKDPATTAMVLTGDGRFFSAGADINAFQEAIDSNTAPELIRNLTGVLHPFLMRNLPFPRPSLWPPQRVSAGGGLGLALACDARVGTPDARMAASYAGMGLSPDGGTTWLLPRLVGEQRARRFFMGNEIWSGEEAHQFGAIDVLVDPGSLLETAMGLAKMWSSWGPHTKEATKHLLHVQTDNDFATHLDHERTLIEAAGTTEAFREGVAAFLEKRPPSFN